jgi:hypothetical protein
MSGRPLGAVVDAGEDAYDERVHDVPLERGAASMVGPGLGHVRRQVGRLTDRLRAQWLADQGVSRGSGEDRRAADAGQCDACPRDQLTRGLDRDRHSGGGEVADPALQLEIATRGRALRGRDHGLDRDLVDGQRVLERAGDEVDERDGAAAVHSLRDDVAAERGHDRGPVTLRVGVTQRPDERPAVAHDRIGNEGGCRSHRRLALGEQRRALEVRVPAERTDPDRAVRVGPVISQVGNPVDVDQEVG